MKVLNFSLIAACLCAVFLMGCEEEEGVIDAGEETRMAQELVDEGIDILAPNLVFIILSEGQDTVALGRMAAANAKFREAIVHDPNNVDAHFGAGLTEVLLIADDPELQQLFYGNTGFAKRSGIGGRNQLDFSALAPAFPTSFRSIVLSPKMPLQALYTVFSSAVQDPILFSFYQDLIEERVLPRIQYAIERFTFVSQHEDFVFLITPERFGTFVQESIEIDLVEIYAILAILHFINADGSILVAYDVDYDDTSEETVVAALQVDSPFLALRTSGSERMADAGTSFLAVVSSIESGIEFLRSETDDQSDDVIRLDPSDEAGLNLLVGQLDTLELFLTTDQTINEDLDGDGELEQLTVRLSSIFNNPIANFKQKLPSYSPRAVQIAEGHYTAVLTWDANSFAEWIFPDPTFNNIFPGMTDLQFKDTFGIRDVDWTKEFFLGP